MVRETLFASETEWPPVDICSSDRVIGGVGDDTMQKLPLSVWAVCFEYLLDPDPMRTPNPEHDQYRNYLVDLVPNHTCVHARTTKTYFLALTFFVFCDRLSVPSEFSRVAMVVVVVACYVRVMELGKKDG